jgi:ABC-type nitrate/sulfonate/bicarbonate transport system permease component
VVHTVNRAVKSRWARMPPALAGLFCLVLLLALVEVAVRADIIPRTVVARPSDAIAGLMTSQNRADLRDGFLITFGMTAIAMVLELLVALPLGYFLFRRRDFALAYSGWLAALFAAPIFLLYPLFLVIFGRNEMTLIIMGFLPGVIPLIIQVEEGFRGVSSTLINVGRSVGVTAWQNFWKIMVPAAAPNIFTGFRLALIYTLINIIAIEYLVDIGGLGRIVADRYFRFDISGTYTAIIAIAAISVLFNWLIGRLERWVRPT